MKICPKFVCINWKFQQKDVLNHRIYKRNKKNFQVAKLKLRPIRLWSFVYLETSFIGSSKRGFFSLIFKIEKKSSEKNFKIIFETYSSSNMFKTYHM